MISAGRGQCGAKVSKVHEVPTYSENTNQTGVTLAILSMRVLLSLL